MTLGKKWQQLLYIQMATVSHRYPDWSIDRVRQQATVEFEKLDKDEFLYVVARGTTEELLRLGQWKDARQTWWLFFRQLSARQKTRLVVTSGREVFCSWRDRAGKG
jgi:hypothetical protein